MKKFMLNVNILLFLNNICCSSFPNLEYFCKFFYIQALNFLLTKSKNLIFSSRERVFFASLPASCWFDKAMFANLMLLMMMNCFCGMVDRQKVFNFISSGDHCQRSSPLRISNTLCPAFEPV